MMLTKVPELAAEAVRAGVDRIFVDLEIRGKRERQRGRATVISGHSIDDVGRIHAVIGTAELLVRVNPPGSWTEDEVEKVLAAGADVVMLPYFTELAEVEAFVQAVRGRATVCLLLEPAAAVARVDQFAALDGVNEIHVGLNDLHASMGLTFMYELLAGGLLDHISTRIRESCRPVRFGFGGGALLDAQHPLSPADVLREHIRLGSQMLILSKTFTGDASSVEELRGRLDLPREVNRIREVLAAARTRSKAEVEADRRRIHEQIWHVARDLNRRS